MTDDAELLRSYAENRSQAAFTELVRRHINLVYSVALRQVGGDVHLAQDVTQKVFADLARKAPALAQRAVISGWLYHGAKFAATDVVRSEQRRRWREQATEVMPDTTPAGEMNWEQARPVLDEAMAELSEADRDAVALRFFESRSFPEIGGKLGLTEDAARKRVERALEKLHAWLLRRGIPSSVVALSTALGGQGAIAAPAGLVTTVAGAGAGGTILTFMSLTKLQIGITAGVVAVAAGGISWHFQASPSVPRVESSPVKVVSVPPAAPPQPAPLPPSSVNVPAPAVAGPRLAQGGPPPPPDAAAAAQRAAQNRRMILRRYGALYDQLGLSAAQREKLTQLLIDDREASVDYGAANAAQGIDASKDAHDFTVSVYKARLALKNQINDLLGDEKYARFVAGDDAIRQAAVVERLQKDLKVIDARLSPTQAEQLQGVLHELGMHYVDDAVVARAGAFLSPQQMDVLKTLQMRRDHGEKKEKVQQAIKANLPGATTGK